MSKYDSLWWTQEATERQCAANRANSQLQLAVSMVQRVRRGPGVLEFAGTETRSTEVDQAALAAAAALETLLPYISLDHMRYMEKSKRTTLVHEAKESRAAATILRMAAALE